jgi:hypothetical protein
MHNVASLITSFIVGKSNPSPRKDFATSMFLVLIVNLAVGPDYDIYFSS